jgi:hypothetical protein
MYQQFKPVLSKELASIKEAGLYKKKELSLHLKRQKLQLRVVRRF